MARKVNGAVQKGYLWQGQLRIVAELDASGQVTSRFIYGTRVNVPEYMLKGGVTYRLITDQLGSVRLVVNASTGAIAQRIDYDEFGVATLVTGTWDFQPFGFAGGLYDPDTKLVRFGARDYDAETGRWTGKDPILFRGGINFYDYCYGDPINNKDIIGTGMPPKKHFPDPKKVREDGSCSYYELYWDYWNYPDDPDMEAFCDSYVDKKERKGREYSEYHRECYDDQCSTASVICVFCVPRPVCIAQ